MTEAVQLALITAIPTTLSALGLYFGKRASDKADASSAASRDAAQKTSEVHEETLKVAEKVSNLEVKVDGRLSQILVVTQQAAEALGIAKGIKQEQERVATMAAVAKESEPKT